MLRIPTSASGAAAFAKDLVDEMMATSEERGMVYARAAQYYFRGSADERAAIMNKVGPFVDRLSGYYYVPEAVRFNVVFDSSEPPDVLERGHAVSQILSAEYRSTDADLRFGDAVLWGLINGCHLLKHLGDGFSFKAVPVHPVNFGVLDEATVSIEEQEAFVHVSYPTMTRLRSILRQQAHPKAEEIIGDIETRSKAADEGEPSYFHQMVVGGMNPVGTENQPNPEAAGLVQVFPLPRPWRPNRRISPTVKLCEVWIKDEKRDGAYTVLQLVYPDILIEGSVTRRNILGGPKLASVQPFVKVQADLTPGYFWGRSIIAVVQMLQDLVNKRLRDIKVMWDRNTNAPQALAGFQGLTEEMYYKVISEGGFISDPNPNAKASKLVEPPPQGYLEELEFIWKMFDEAGGFTPVMTGQGDPSVRAGVHAQTLVRQSSPGLIDPATRIERALADSGHVALQLMQDNDPHIYSVDSAKTEFLLEQLPTPFQVEVDSHSASPAFAEDSRQMAIALARAGAISGEDLIEMLHPPNAPLLLARMRARQAQQAKMQQEQQAQAIATGQPPPGPNGTQRVSRRRPAAQ